MERLESEVKAHDAETLLQGAKELLETLGAKLEKDSSWASKRRIVEALVAGVEVESQFDVCAPRGKARKASLRISYRCEVPDLEDAALQTPKTMLTPSGLMLNRLHGNAVLVTNAYSEAREVAKELLKMNPKLLSTEVIAQFQKRGLQMSRPSVSRPSVSRPSVSRLRAGLKEAGSRPTGLRLALISHRYQPSG